MIVPEALPGIKRFLKPLGMNQRALGLVIRCVAALCLHGGRMSAVPAAGVVWSEPRHRAQICRCLGRQYLLKRRLLPPLQAAALALEAKAGRFVFLIDPTLCSQQGDKTENTYSTGNRKRRPRQGSRYSKYQHARQRGPCFVIGLLLTPSGIRIPFRRSYDPKEYGTKTERPYRQQTELAADMIREWPLLDGADVVVLGDTAFDAATIGEACAIRQYRWIVPMNPERVWARAKPRPKGWSLAKEWSAGQMKAIRLYPNKGTYVAMRRLSASRIGPQVKPRVFYAPQASRDVHSVGEVRLVFSTREQPQAGLPVRAQKILMTNDSCLTASEVVELDDWRWQIELFFKEWKSTLGFDQYRFRRFEPVEGWREMTLVALLYWEVHRARQLKSSGLSNEEKERWRCPRTHGLCIAMRRNAERADIDFLVKALQTEGGIRRLRRQLDKSTQAEYRTAS